MSPPGALTRGRVIRPVFPICEVNIQFKYKQDYDGSLVTTLPAATLCWLLAHLNLNKHQKQKTTRVNFEAGSGSGMLLCPQWVPLMSSNQTSNNCPTSTITPPVLSIYSFMVDVLHNMITHCHCDVFKDNARKNRNWYRKEKSKEFGMYMRTHWGCSDGLILPYAIVIISFSCNGQIRKSWTAPPTLIIPAPPSLTAKG